MGHSHSGVDGAEHQHDHSGLFHSHAPADKMKQVFFLALVILIAEIVFGLISNSLALLADAWHMATDVAAIGLSWFALEQAKKQPNKKMTFGYERAGILAAAINGLTLIAITVWILYSAVIRIMNPEPVHGWGMFVGAGIGLVANLFIIFVLNGEGDNLNVKSALIHVIGDVGASAGVIIAAIIIYFTGWLYIDPLLSVLIAILVAFSAWNITGQSFRILMQATPKDMNLDDIATKVCSIPGVQSVHDMHIWTLTSERNILTCHAVLNEGIQLNEGQDILKEINQLLKKMGIQHSTIQIEDANTNHHDDLICSDINGAHDHEHS